VDIDAVTVLATSGVLLLLALVIGWAVLRRTTFRHRPPRSGTPPPTDWRVLIARRVSITRGLTEPEWDTLLALVQEFLRDKRFEGRGGVDVTEEMQVLVAAQACLLILHLNVGCYPRVRSVLIYPNTFVPRRPSFDGRLYEGPLSPPEPLLGEFVSGVVVLSWESVEQGAQGGNVVLHEFAHELDRQDGYVDGIPLLEPPSSTRTWAQVLNERFLELRRDVALGRETALNAYGATNRAEFFAVATESFFTRPHVFQASYPDLYRELREFYRQDPAARADAPPLAETGPVPD
jgi:Mlc titration factor MtfA (ptsG expression regulator)